MKMALVVSSILCTLLCSACEYHPYRADDPSEYQKFWCKPENFSRTAIVLSRGTSGSNNYEAFCGKPEINR